MKKSFIFILAIFYLPAVLLADAASIVLLPGGNVKPMQNESIKMVKEKINITFLSGRFEVRVDYVFYNSGEKQTAIMGFPNSRGSDGGPENMRYGIEDFKAFAGEKELQVERKETEGPEVTKVVPVYETFTVDFDAGETKRITNIYSQKYFDEYGKPIKSAKYILTTGATWKGSIDSIWVNIYSNLPDHDFSKRTIYVLEESGDERWYDKVEYKLDVFPKAYIREDNIIKMLFTDIEPDFDIDISMPPPSIFSLFASSELDEDKNDKYAAKNMVDGDPSTAWVEGKKDNGINEYIKFYCPPEENDMVDLYSAYKIKGLGIINGYAKNESVFYKNNRVKKVRIEYKNDIFREENPDSMKKQGNFEFILEDKMEMQFLKFTEPIYMSSMKITILEVYKGSKWNDTCISELQTIPSE